MKLKTLKDFGYHSGCRAGNEKYLSKEILKQEAIKHIKDIALRKTTFEGVIHNQRVSAWIKHFFNLTNEDLK